MTTAEFIGKVETLNDKYDLIYIGTCKDHMNTVKGVADSPAAGSTVFNDHAMDGLVYYHTGDMRYSSLELSGMLDTDYVNGNRAESVYFYTPVRYGGNNITRGEKVTAGDVYVDGSRIGDVGNAVIKDRILMSNNGILVIIANIDTHNKVLMGSPAITTRGYILVNENIDLIRDIQHSAEEIINKELKKKVFNFNDMKSEMINGLMPILSDKTGRVPIILPIVMEVKSNKTKEEVK